MFYSHTQARAKLPKKLRRVLPIEQPRILRAPQRASAVTSSGAGSRTGGTNGRGPGGPGSNSIGSGYHHRAAMLNSGATSLNSTISSAHGLPAAVHHHQQQQHAGISHNLHHSHNAPLPPAGSLKNGTSSGPVPAHPLALTASALPNTATSPSPATTTVKAEVNATLLSPTKEELPVVDEESPATVSAGGGAFRQSSTFACFTTSPLLLTATQPTCKFDFRFYQFLTSSNQILLFLLFDLSKKQRFLTF